MALVWIEGFDYCTNTSQFSNNWVSDVSTDGSNGRYGGRAGTWGSGTVATVSVVADDTYVIGFAWKQTAQAANSDRYLISFNESGTAHVRLSTGDGTTATPQITRGNGTVLGTCSMSPLQASTWYHFQMKVTVHDTTGAVEVKVNGSTVFSASGIDTRNGGTSGVINTIAMRGDFTAYFDDMWIDDSTFIGDCRIETVVPTGAGASTQFTPSAGSNFQNVDEVTPNDDTDYNASSTVGHIDTFAMGNLATTAGTVYAVQQRTRARKDDAGSRNMRSVIRTGGSNYESADKALGDSYLGFTDLRLTNPNTAAAWTIAEVNAIEAGYKVES